MSLISTVDNVSWQDNFNSVTQSGILKALEQGEVIYFPSLPFKLMDSEEDLLTESILLQKIKNISLTPRGHLKGSVLKGDDLEPLEQMMSRFRQSALQLLNNLVPYYQYNLKVGRTSFRPAEIIGRKTSIRQDDTRLHVDAFRATPNQGKRILRVFTNINPEERNRIWNLGEPFEAVVEKFKSQLKKPMVGTRKLLQLLKITKSYRTLYDHYMLQLHDAMKCDEEYQKNVAKIEIYFPPGATWIVMTDAVSHAALAGQFMLEQTFYLPFQAMQNEALSPLRILERHLQQKLL